MRVMIDGRPLQGPTGRRGVGHYVRSLICGLSALDPLLEIVLLVDPREEAPLGPALADLTVAQAAAPPGPALLWGRVLGPRWIAKAHPDVVHSTFLAPPRPPARTAWVATIHDLIALRHPGAFTWRQRLVFRRSLELASRADEVIAVSRYTADEIIRNFGTPGDRVHVVPPPVDVARFANPAQKGLAHLDRPYVLHLGGFDPLKGVCDLLIPAFARIAPRRPDLALVLSGGPSPGRRLAERAVREAGVDKQVVFAGLLGDGEHCAAVAGASAIVVASHEEGFGIPVVEALAAGVPVAIGPAWATREIAPELTFLSATPTIAGLEHALEEALRAPGPGAAEGEKRRQFARRFDQVNVARQVLAVYERSLRRA